MCKELASNNMRVVTGISFMENCYGVMGTQKIGHLKKVHAHLLVSHRQHRRNEANLVCQLELHEAHVPRANISASNNYVAE